MMVASASLVVPSALSEVHCKADPDCEDSVLLLSRAIAIGLLLLFTLYLNFRLRSHRTLFEDDLVQDSHGQVEAEPLLRIIAEVVIMSGVLILASFCAVFLIRTVDVVVQSSWISHKVVSFVLIPLVADGPARVEAIIAAYHNRMTVALDFAIGRSMQVALFVAPLLVLISMMMQTSSSMTLHFPSLETISFFLSILLVTELCRDGKSNYLEGAMCLVTYV
jgi:Ca2+:H+ antiporter